LGTVAVVVLGYFGVQALLRSPGLAQPLVLAHRGGPALGPESTLATYQRAIDAGVQWLELDVQMSKDGVLVVIHDETVDRTTNGTGAVADLTFDELRKLDAGEGQKIPSFDEAVALAKTSGVNLFPETKSAHLYPGVEAKLLAALEEADYLDHAIIQSFEAAPVRAERTVEAQRGRSARRCPIRLPYGGNGHPQPLHDPPGPQRGPPGDHLVWPG
jgi:glycerophosphoryl diester phosphodiesterase